MPLRAVFRGGEEPSSQALGSLRPGPGFACFLVRRMEDARKGGHGPREPGQPVTHMHPTRWATGRGRVCLSRWCTHSGAGLGLSLTNAVLLLSRLSNITEFKTTQDNRPLGPHVRTNRREVWVIQVSTASVPTPAADAPPVGSGTRREDPAPQPPSAIAAPEPVCRLRREPAAPLSLTPGHVPATQHSFTGP